MGGGALSFENVSKLGRKIKIVQQVRNDMRRHAEFISASLTHPSLPLEREGTQNPLSSPLAGEEVNCTLKSGHTKVAFTLAEVLITLGIISVVVALTLPSVIERHQKLETVIKLKKVYSTLSQAIERAKVDNGDIQNWGLGDFYGLSADDNRKIAIDFSEKYLIPYLKNVKSARFVTPKNFGYDKISNLDGTTPRWHDLVTPRYILVLNDGTVVSIGIDCINKGTSENRQNVIWAIVFFVDLNGIKGPNVVGRDIFAFLLRTQDNTKFTPYVYSNTTYSNALSLCQSGGLESRLCTAVIMMDGWQIKDHYPWRFQKSQQ